MVSEKQAKSISVKSQGHLVVLTRVKVTIFCRLSKLLRQTTFDPSFIGVGMIVSDI